MVLINETAAVCGRRAEAAEAEEDQDLGSRAPVDLQPLARSFQYNLRHAENARQYLLSTSVICASWVPNNCSQGHISVSPQRLLSAAQVRVIWALRSALAGSFLAHAVHVL
jgi:hypothetical protein